MEGFIEEVIFHNEEMRRENSRQSGQDKQTPGDDKACVLWVQRLEVK